MTKTIVRPVKVSDAEAIHRIGTQKSVIPNIIFLPSIRVSTIEERLKNLRPIDHEFVAEVDGEVVGHIGLTQGQGRRSHRGEVFIYVDEKHHGKGIGSSLLNKILDLADNWLMLERVELTVLEINPLAQKLYEGLGFQIEGKKLGSVKSAGKYVSEIIMARFHPNSQINKS